MKKKIKVLFWGDSPNCSTGFASVTKNILNYLVKTGKYEISVIGINDRGGWKNPMIYPYKIYPAKIGIDASGGDYHGRDRLVATMLGKDPDIKFPFDIVFTLNDPFVLEQPIPVLKKGTLEILKEAQAITKKKLPDRYWFKIVSYWPIDSYIRPNWANTISLSDYPVAYCNYGKKEIIKASIGEKSFDDLEKKLTHIYHGISLRDFFPIDKKESDEFREKLIVSIARNQLRKDLPRTLAIFSELLKRRPDSFLYIHAQETDSWGSLREYASNFKNLEFGVNWGTPSKFTANEGYPIDMMNMIYNAADCVLSTTLGEGFGFYNLEGMATKTLIVAPNNTTHPELFGYNAKDDITDMDKIHQNLRGVPMLCGETKTNWGTYGQLDYERMRPLTNVEDAVKKLLWVYDNPQKAEEIENRAYEWIKQYDWPLVCKQWDDLLQRVYNDLLKEREEYGNKPESTDSKSTDSKA
jgi:glycosyltransferase involved in cell wall biosynthesis